MRIQDQQLQRFIADAGLVSKKDLSMASELARKDGRPLSDVLLSSGYLTEDDLRHVEAYILGVPFESLHHKKIDWSVLSLIPEPVARGHNIVAFKKDERTIGVAFLNIADLSAVEFLSKKTGLRLTPHFTDQESMRSALLQYQRILKSEFGDIIAAEAKSFKDTDDLSTAPASILNRIAESPAVTKMVDTLLRHAVVQDASDIHIEPADRDTLVRYRIDGLLRDTMVLPKAAAAAMVVRLKLLSKMKLEDRQLPQDGRFRMEMDGQRISFRVTSVPVFYGEKASLRLLRENRSGFTLEGIGFHGEPLERVYEALTRRQGLVLVAGTEGSGRTTTLYTVLDLLNTPQLNISTIEENIEYQMPRVNQTKTKPEIGLTFAAGLRAILKQDPDVIMVGEIKDKETADLAVGAAETGRLVLATISAANASSAVTRLLEFGLEPARVAHALRLVIGQTLVRQLTTAKEPYTLVGEAREELSQSANLERIMHHLKEERVMSGAATWSSIPFYRPLPNLTDDEAYKGRFGLHEVLKVTAAVKDKILQEVAPEHIEVVARREGMLTMLEDGVYMAARGVTSIEEVKRVVGD